MAAEIPKIPEIAPDAPISTESPFPRMYEDVIPWKIAPPSPATRYNPINLGLPMDLSANPPMYASANKLNAIWAIPA